MKKLTARTRIVGAALAAAVSLLVMSKSSHALPPGFTDELVVGGWNQAVGVCFAPDGRGFVWEKGGKVWLVENGAKSSQPLIDISDEVGNWRDLGLLGFAIDPDFNNNGYIYLLYVVDFHHLRFAGTPEYDPGANEYFRDTIGRLTRYTANAADGFRSVDPASRLVLVGETITSGFPVTHESHSIGTVVFGEDGSLIVGNGDGASFVTADAGGFRVGSSNTALADGIITPEEDVGAFRCQMVDSLSGKVVRIDPATGDGLPGNPYFDAATPRSARSRMWSMGLRNPFRFTIRPGTGHNHGTGAPGVLYIGEVGWNGAEEIDVAPVGGLNFGWPLFEGLFYNQAYLAASPPNLNAPNPLHGLGGCELPHFRFHHLILQATLAAPSWPNPCDTGQQVPAEIPQFVHTRPVLTWGHGQPVRVPTFTGDAASSAVLGSPESPVEGQPFGGQSSVGGVWYTGTGFPEAYRNVYFQGDFVGGWIQAFDFDDFNRLTEVRPFATGLGALVAITVNPADGALYYLAFSSTGESRLRRITSSTAAAPVAAAAATPQFGPLPLTVQFSSDGSMDPGGEALTYQWDFGDGSPPVYAANPSHTYNGLIDLTSLGTFTARVYELTPPGPYGMGNWDPEVMRDKDYPPAGSTDSMRQFDTYHEGHQGLEEFIGYTFDTPYVLTRVVFQEGKHFYDGGWFESFTVEYRSGGVWLPVSTLFTSPAYPGANGVNYETFVLTFQSVLADGIRIRGVPGGLNRFISVGELRVSGLPLGIGNAPRRYDATLTVRDPAGDSDVANVLVSPANTPPQVEILSPAPDSLYRMTSSVTLPLRAQIADAQHAPAALACAWQVILHHNDHSHPEPPIQDCQPDVVLSPVGCDGETYSFEFALTVTDAHGLSTTRSVFMHPSCCLPDWDFDGQVNSGDVAAFLTSWLEAVGTGSLVADYNGDGAVNSGDISAFLTGWIALVPTGC